MRLRIIFLCAFALCLPIASEAQSFSYRSVDVAFLPSAKVDGAGINESGNGFLIRGSLNVVQNFFALTEFQDLNLDNSVDTSRIAIGGGGHWPINKQIDVIARAGIVRYKVDVGRFSDDDTGPWIGGRIRALVAPQLELEGGFEYQHVEAAGLKNDSFLVGEARYNFNPQWSAGVIVNVGGDTTVFGVQARLNF
jgi:outer membrane protein with beta-barrel domain